MSFVLTLATHLELCSAPLFHNGAINNVKARERKTERREKQMQGERKKILQRRGRKISVLRKIVLWNNCQERLFRIL